MKRFFAISLLLLTAVCFMFAGCGNGSQYVPEGPTDVNYGNVSYIPFEDGGALKFSYLDCFTAPEQEEEEDNFVGSTPDKKGVLAFEFYDSFKDYENSTQYYKIPSRKYAEILAYTDEEAADYLKVALGMVESQGAVYTVDDFKFEKFDHYIRLYMEATGEYAATGEIQKLWIEKYVVDNERVYTIHAFAPASCLTKYGPAFKDTAFDIEAALTNANGAD